MNILFFLTPKAMCAYIESDDTLRQAMERMEHSGYAALPVLDKSGKYCGVVTEGDLLWTLKRLCVMDLRQTEEHSISEIEHRRTVQPEPQADFGARVFKVARDAQGNRLTYMKITGGSLAVRAALKVLGPNAVAALPAGCMSAVGFNFPQLCFANNAMITPFAATAAVLPTVSIWRLNS